MSRRNFLRGALGVTLGLPFLESLSRPEAHAGGSSANKRLIVFFCCNGVNMDRFWPSVGYGALSQASFAADCGMAPLAPFAERLLIPRGMHMSPRGFGWDASAGDDHAKGMGCKLTARRLIEGSVYADGISVDQHIANAVNPAGTPSLTLMAGWRADGVLGNISYSGSNAPVLAENNPRLAYLDLVGLGNLDDEELAMFTARRQSVLDLVQDEYSSLLSRRLSKADRDKLQSHFDTVRDLENTINGSIACELDPARAAELELIDPNTVANDSEYKKIGQLQLDVLALAIACGATKVGTMLWGSGAGGPIFNWDGLNHQYNHHKLSHGNTMDDNSGGEVAGYEDMLAGIDQWYTTQLAYLLTRLDSYQEGDGQSVLDNTAVVYMNELSHGKDHDFRDLPVIIAGGCGGYFKQGEYVKVTAQEDTRNDADASHNKLLTTLCNAMGVPESHFGAPDLGEDGEFDQLKA
ncbi:MAG: DUF1552 domain-containing protein [Polyangiaceae bacterium]|nr:DUF1552 domain-containing protein [Polyangiaceae bacterium]